LFPDLFPTVPFSCQFWQALPNNTKGSCNQCEHYGGWISTMIGV